MSVYSIEDKIQSAIDSVKNYAADLPGVLVLHDLRTWKVAWMSERGLSQLGITLEEVTSISAEDYYARYFNPEDAKDYVPKILGLFDKETDDNICTYFQQVRFAGHSDWKWHMSSTKVYMRDDENKPLLTITMAFPIDAMHHMTAKAERILQENNFLRKNIQKFRLLSEREQEILKHLSLGQNSSEIADTLFISEHTVDTHKRNIKRKLRVSSMYELGEYARAFNLI